MFKKKNHKNKFVEMPGFEPGASYMRSKRSTAELHPHFIRRREHKIVQLHCD